MISDRGLAGLVVRVAIDTWSPTKVGDRIWLSTGAGLSWDQTVRRVTALDWAGIECLVGIPGRVGAAR